MISEHLAEYHHRLNSVASLNMREQLSWGCNRRCMLITQNPDHISRCIRFLIFIILKKSVRYLRKLSRNRTSNAIHVGLKLWPIIPLGSHVVMQWSAPLSASAAENHMPSRPLTSYIRPTNNLWHRTILQLFQNINLLLAFFY